MVNKSIFLYTGVQRHELTVDTESTLAQFRTEITGNFLNASGDWRFVMGIIKIDINQMATIPYTDAVIGRNIEEYLTVKWLLSDKNVLYMADVTKTKPDLFGLKTNEFKNGNIECYITKNAAACRCKFNPIMLERVRTLKDKAVDYNNVLVCQEGTAIKINIVSKGHTGFGFSIKSETGEWIVEHLYAIYYDVGKQEASTTITRYEKQEKNIIIDTVPITVANSQRYKHQRYTIKVWKLNSYEKNGETVIVQNSSQRCRRSADERRTVNLPSETIRGGTFKPGSDSNEKFTTINNINDDKDDILGIIELDLFVFKSIADANRVFEMNAISA